MESNTQSTVSVRVMWVVTLRNLESLFDLSASEGLRMLREGRAKWNVQVCGPIAERWSCRQQEQDSEMVRDRHRKERER
jgi:hypothetical protein